MQKYNSFASIGITIVIFLAIVILAGRILKDFYNPRIIKIIKIERRQHEKSQFKPKPKSEKHIYDSKDLYDEHTIHVF